MTPADALARIDSLIADARRERADVDHETAWSDHAKRSVKEQLERRANELTHARVGAIVASNVEPHIERWRSWERDLLRVDAELARRERALPQRPEQLPGVEASRALREREGLALARGIVRRGAGGQDGLMPSVLAEVLEALDVRPLPTVVAGDRWSARPGLVETQRRLAEERTAFAEHMKRATSVAGIVEREPDAPARQPSVA